MMVEGAPLGTWVLEYLGSCPGVPGTSSTARNSESSINYPDPGLGDVSVFMLLRVSCKLIWVDSFYMLHIIYTSKPAQVSRRAMELQAISSGIVPPVILLIF